MISILFYCAVAVIMQISPMWEIRLLFYSTSLAEGLKIYNTIMQYKYNNSAAVLSAHDFLNSIVANSTQKLLFCCSCFEVVFFFFKLTHQFSKPPPALHLGSQESVVIRVKKG